jgi:hypothetical protein
MIGSVTWLLRSSSPPADRSSSPPAPVDLILAAGVIFAALETIR